MKHIARGLAGAVLLLCGAVQAQTPAASLKVYLDPATGRLRLPTAAELEAAEAAQPKSIIPMASVPVPLPGGGWSIRAPASMRPEVTLTLDGHGQAHEHCADPGLPARADSR